MKKSIIVVMFTLGLATPFSAVTAGPSGTGMIHALQAKMQASVRQQAAAEKQQQAQQRAADARANAAANKPAFNPGTLNRLIH